MIESKIDGTDQAEQRENIYRVLDANINRVSEGLRVLEDGCRFMYEDKEGAKAFREFRHKVRKTYDENRLVFARKPKTDPGRENSKASNCDSRDSYGTLIKANFKRVQEGIRSIEEHLKVLGLRDLAKSFEEMRFEAYELEKQALLGERINKIRQEKRAQLEKGGLYCITGEEFSKGKTTVECVKEMLAAEVKVIQYREKKKDGITKLRECQEIRALTKAAGCLFIVNDEVGLAMAVKADGIHVGQEDMPLKTVRGLVGEEMLIGVSTHKQAQALLAEKEGADYIGVGPMFETRTKPLVEASDGMHYLNWVRKNISIPRVAIGGIKAENLQKLRPESFFDNLKETLTETAEKQGGKEEKQGSKEEKQWYAVISEVMGAPSIPEKVEELNRIIEGSNKQYKK